MTPRHPERLCAYGLDRLDDLLLEYPNLSNETPISLLDHGKVMILTRGEAVRLVQTAEDDARQSLARIDTEDQTRWVKGTGKCLP